MKMRGEKEGAGNGRFLPVSLLALRCLVKIVIVFFVIGAADRGCIIHSWLALLEIASSLGDDGFDGNPRVYLLYPRSSGPFG